MNEKLKVLIADDEFRIGLLIKTLIKWDELNLECINVVNNGEKAYEVICKEKPHIVITDIQMPRVNGLDLIAMAKEKDKNIKFIVISGYKDFEYAHKALQYGVNDYLLKPINAAELNKNLKEITMALSQEYSKKKEEELFKQEIYASKQIIKKNVLMSIIGEDKAPSLEKIQNTYNILLNTGIYRMIDIKLDYWDFEKIDANQDRITVDRVINITEQAFKGEVHEILFCEKEALNIHCLIVYDANFKEIKNITNKALSEIQEYLLGFEQYEVTMGIGCEKNDFDQIRASYLEASKSVGNRIKLGTGRLIYAETLGEDTFFVSGYIEKFKEKISSSINAYSGEMLKSCIDEIFSINFKEENMNFYHYYDIAKQLIELFFDEIEIKEEKGDQLKQQLLEKYQHCYTVAKLKTMIKKHLCEFLDVCQKILEMKSTKPIRQAKQYIEDHYGEKIVLEDIAEIVGLNPVYFSVLFKKETGLNFSAFLVQVRIENAKKMLKSGNETIAYIAEMVGYKDVRHFSRLFTKTVGVNPALYRKLYS